MPHAVIEYSENITQEIQSFGVLDLIHGAMIKSSLFQAHDIKIRAYPARDVLIGNKGKNGRFIHVAVYLIEGRTTEQKQALTQDIFNILSNKMTGTDSITVDIRELEKSTYRKTAA